MVATSGGHGGKQYNCRAHRPANIYWEIFIKCPIWKNPGYVGDNRPVRFSSAELLVKVLWQCWLVLGNKCHQMI